MNIVEYENYQEKRMHGASDFPYITYICTIPLDFPCVPLHWHEEMELVYFKKGRGSMIIDLELYEVRAGDIALILPGQLHSIEQYHYEKLEYENIIFNLNLLVGKGHDLCTKEYFKPILHGNASLPQIITPQLSWYSSFAGCIDDIDEVCKYYPAAYPLAIKSKLFQMFYILFFNAQKPIPRSRPQKSIDKTKKIIQCIEENYEKHLSIADMAELCHLSESHFMKFFKSALGTTFTEYINDYRLSIAARLLETTDASVLEIATQVGFDNVSYFNRLFRRKYETTPSHYRRDS